MPPVIALPDFVAAMTLRLSSFSEITDLVSTAGGYTSDASIAERARPRISSVRQRYWNLPTHALLLRKSGGPPPHRDARLRTSRLDVWLYGPGVDEGTQEREAYRLWRTVQPALMPPPGESDGFIAAGCCVDGISEEAEPIPLLDRESGWRCLVWPLLINWGMA